MATAIIPTALPTAPTVPAALEPTTDAQICASDLNAANRVKGFLGMTGEIVPSLPADPVAHVKALTDAELFSLGEEALKDIADDLIVLDEIRNRFRAASGGPILGYLSWKDFVEKNSIYSIRTIQNRLAAKNGKDQSKTNAQPGNQYTRAPQCSWCQGTKGTPADGEKLCPSCKAAQVAANNGRPKAPEVPVEVPPSRQVAPVSEPEPAVTPHAPMPSDWLAGYTAGHAAGYTTGFLAATEGKEVHFSERLKVGDKVWVLSWYGRETASSHRVVSKITNKIVTLEPGGQLDRFCLESHDVVGYWIKQRYPKKDDDGHIREESYIIGRVEEAPTLELAQAAEDAWDVQTRADRHRIVALEPTATVPPTDSAEPTAAPPAKNESPLYEEGFLTADEATELNQVCKTLPFVRRANHMDGGKTKIRNMNILYADIKRTHAETTGIERRSMSTAPAVIQTIAARLSERVGREVNYISLMCYEGGKDHIGWHQHREDHGHDTPVMIVSTGAERTFSYRLKDRLKDSRDRTDILAKRGSLIILPSSFNTSHEHAVLDDKTCTGTRYAINAKCMDDIYYNAG